MRKLAVMPVLPDHVVAVQAVASLSAIRPNIKADRAAFPLLLLLKAVRACRDPGVFALYWTFCHVINLQTTPNW